MSAQEVIEQIKAMPPEGRREVVQFVRQHEISPVVARERGPDWDRLIEEVFDEHDELFRKLAQ